MPPPPRQRAGIEPGPSPRRRLRWGVSAAVIALTLWAIISLSQTYTWRIEIPLTTALDSTREALAEPLPRTLSVRARGDGWTLMRIMAGHALRCRIDPRNRYVTSTGSNDSIRIYSFNEREIINSINLPSSLRIEDVRPTTLRMAVTALASKRVPLYYPGISVDTRAGFQIIGQPRVRPDSVRISGAPEAIARLTHWYTVPLSLKDIYGPTTHLLPVSDSLGGVITATPRIVSVSVDVQEVAEVMLDDLFVVNRSDISGSDTVYRLLLYPDRVTVTLRGGAGELGQIDVENVIPSVSLLPGVDTTGFVQPRITLPAYSNATVIAVQPERIRYAWRLPAGRGREKGEGSGE